MPFTAEELIRKAIDLAGCSEFGNPPMGEALERLIESLNAEANLSPTGEAMAKASIVAALRNRLRIESYWSSHPQLSESCVERPIIIVGMSRSGTTALSHLLGKDRTLRSLLRWEASDSVPPPDERTYWDDPRYRASLVADAQPTLPGVRQLHYDPPDAPVECNSLFAHQFNSSVYWTVFFLPAYMRWTMTSEPGDIYTYHHRMLTLLQSERPGRWSLKGPQHAMSMRALRARYPDASLIATHRDPAVCAASTASLMTFLHRVSSVESRPETVGALAAEFIERCAAGLVDDADRHGDGAMVHVHYEELLANPLDTIRRIYREINHELTRETEDAMRAHMEIRPQHQYGRHQYDFADFGLARDSLNEMYRFYRDRFDVPQETR